MVFISDPVIDVHPPRSLLRLLLDGSDAMSLHAMGATGFEPGDLAVFAPERNLAIFVAPDDEKTLVALGTCLDLSDPQRNRFPIAADRELVLYFVAASHRYPPCVARTGGGIALNH